MTYTMTDWAIPDMPGETLRTAVNASGAYIGDEETAKYLCEQRGIAPELATPEHRVCSIGFCETEQKWYGWSHRAIYGFGVGSTVKRGDCGYVPVDWPDFLQYACEFWADEYHPETRAERTSDNEGRECAKVTWTYNDQVPNEKLRGTTGGTTMYPPKEWGRGEWTAATLDDAKQMAIDFAEGVS